MNNPTRPSPDTSTSRRGFLKSAGSLAAGAAAAGSVAVGIGACAPDAPIDSAVDQGGAPRLRVRGFDRSVLDPLGEVLLPASIGAEARTAAVSAFVAWVDGYEPVAEEMHGYGYADVRYLPPDPAPAWRAQLDGLNTLAARVHGKAFPLLDLARRESVVTMALRGVSGDRLPDPLRAPHIAIALLSHWASSAGAWNIALGAVVSPGTCRPLADAVRAPLPLAATGNGAPS